jgi:hypothetical protein
MDELVERLSNGVHPVEVSLRPDRTVQAFKECLDRGYVHIKFTATRGGTELGVRVDAQATDATSADFTGERGTIKVVGDLTLNDVKVRCLADVELATLRGTGCLQPVVH